MQLRNENIKNMDLDLHVEIAHHPGKDYIWTVTAPKLWHIVYEGREDLLEKFLDRITDKHLALKPSKQSDTFYYNYPTILEVMIRNQFIGLPLLQRNSIITADFLMKHLDKDQQISYLLKLVESEDITNFCECSDAGMLKTADGLEDEEEIIREYDTKTKKLYERVVEEALIQPISLRELPTFFQNKINKDVLERKERLRTVTP